MESSKVLGVSEECGSSESGWTMYIASSIHEDSNYENDDYDDLHTDRKGDDNDGDDDDESDDSMASDASSGPSHPEVPYGSAKGSRVLGHFKHEDQSKGSSGKKPYKKGEKKIFEKRTKAEKEVPGHKANRAAGYAHSGAKVRTNKTEKK